MEHGGDTIIDFSRNVIMPATIQVGKYDKVDLTRGVVDWHTHPAKCMNSDMCTIGLPSPSDMVNVIIGVSKGTLAHMVYSREGTYVVQVKNAVREKLLYDFSFYKTKSNQVGDAFDNLYDRYGLTPHEKREFRAVRSRKPSYAGFQKDFMALAKREGMCVQLFKGNTVPKFTLKFNCSVIQGGPGLTATVQ
jgi:hypothetical protein